MGETDLRFAELVGELRADMRESQRQRSKLFDVAENITHQLTELTAKFEAHAEEEQDHRSRQDARIDSLKGASGHGSKSAGGPGKTKRNVAFGLGGTGLLGAIFGDNIIENMGKLAEAIRRVLH